MNKIQVKANTKASESKFKKKVEANTKVSTTEAPEFQGRQAQQPVGVSGVVLLAGKVGTQALLDKINKELPNI